MDPQQRRRQILDRSAEIFARKGINATTIRDIAKAVGVHSGALYHYFPSKEAIVTELIREYIDDISERCREVMALALSPLERMEALAEIALDSNVQYHGATSIWRREGDYMRERVVEADMATTADEMEAAWRSTIADGVADGTLRTDIDSEILREMLYDVLWHATRWHHPEPGESMAELAHTIITVFIDGMRNRPE
ncbi:TetR/AcrR family transcriptional regulator [Rhodococcus sp. HNM0563]|uniref:TetR/AcrR family transcriptional regulator n=1 Tax=unclassified Rhodococcus (in: high G+C Gram-positive bacteria) TaxID=192944 RepID=UPI00146EE9D9|nr:MULTISPECIES: TetR/AcrR family transcriptional regulator [unclassified Rhodococcus (in: high G+C Gram-positive bacteria)]MCK0090574.1 TetR/AcrR family transcriptional regulator [Rhodococcus sp. F64268]NLU61769.1 TetR/AcrR family transcriptional regulator [Rhodococcus sp. HNM0563]